MARRTAQHQQSSRDTQRAVALISRVRGLTTDESADALRLRASDTGVSVHAAALAVMATSPTDELVTDRSASIPSPRTPAPVAGP